MNKDTINQVNILGTRGIPAAHGGFETFVGRLAPYLRDKGYKVTVYCQDEAGNNFEDEWEGIHRVHIAPKSKGALGTMEFDWKSVVDVVKRPGTDLVLGYNTSIFNILQKLYRRRVVINMDGIEWKRAKWSIFAKIWFYLNELVGANIANLAIADHPKIKEHTRKRSFRTIKMIPYGSDSLDTADPEHLTKLGIEANNYFVSIARIEPENSILELVQAFSNINTDAKCVILGRLEEGNRYHNSIKEAANENVIFPGAIYDSEIVSSLRVNCLAYLHGHQVGGTNPSLVEALGCGNPVIAHDNPFNQWTAGKEQLFFSSISQATEKMEEMLSEPGKRSLLARHARQQHASNFEWETVLAAYEQAIFPRELMSSKYEK